MERESSNPRVTIRPHSRMPVALAVLLVLLQLFSPNRAWVILLCRVGGMTLAASLAKRMLRQNRAVGLVAYGAREAYLMPGWSRRAGGGRIWREMASRLGVPVHPWDTPAEFAAAMERELARRRPRGTWLRQAVRVEVEGALAETFLVTKAYEQVSYAPTSPDLALMQRIGQEGWRLRWRLWRLWAFST